ncbi:hypothetical protein YC2023_114749 [Brassica napus]
MDPNNCRNVTDAVEVNGESIVSVVKEEDWFKKQKSRVKVIDYGKDSNSSNTIGLDSFD